MKAKIYIDDTLIGTAEFRISDESMGGIIGHLIPNEHYTYYKKQIQLKSKEKGIANASDFNFRILIENKDELNPVGGIGITDFEEFEDIIIESGGNEQEIIKRIKKQSN